MQGLFGLSLLAKLAPPCLVEPKILGKLSLDTVGNAECLGYWPARCLHAYAETVHALQSSFAMAIAVSDIRQEKPHSLSYQLRMRTMLPSSTFV